MKRFILATISLAAIAILGFISLGKVQNKATLLGQNTLHGLTYAGMANGDMAEDFNCTLMMVLANNPADCATYCAKSQHFALESGDYLTEYEKAIVTPGDRSCFNDVIARRKEYSAIRERVFALVREGRTADAVTVCRESLLPAYKQYTAAGDALLSYNIHQGEMRGQAILRFCRLTQYAVAGCVVALFLTGFIIGVFK